ncbi:hypothetical protein JXA80_09810 [bacterium]|nr:hypothetical protein [candidate division CSSED10-310 bacterium]
MNRIPFSLFAFGLIITTTWFDHPLFAARWVFDASSLPMAGDNADWVVDAPEATGNQSLPDRYPSPDPCDVGATTPEDFWHGAYSAWGIELVKSGHWVETIPRNAAITYGDCSNSQDLSFFDVFVIPEPQVYFTAEETAAIINFVFDGGSLFLIGNHCGSDRNNNGEDSAMIYGEMDTAGHFGIEFETYPGCTDNEPPPECDACSWNDVRNTNFVNDPSDPFLYGPAGTVEAIKFNEATSLILHPENNPSVQGHAWRDESAQGTIDVTLASALFGDGRVVAIGDSAPADDGTGDEDDFLHNSWDYPTSENNILFVNISHWLSHPETTPLPTRTPCPNHTPWPKCNGTATPGPTQFTPTPTPTGNHHGPAVDISTNQFVYRAGDTFVLTEVISNSGAGRTVDYYLALEVSGLFFFAPGWSQNVEYESLYIAPGYESERTIFQFTWPEAGNINGMRFWALFLDPVTQTIIGDYDLAEFSCA